VNAYTQKDYEAIEAAVLESPRGRWFLNEFTRRNRAADTLMLLEAIRKLERGVAENPQVSGELAAELHAVSNTIGSTLDRAGEDDMRTALDELSEAKRRIDVLLAKRPDSGDGELTAENLKYFEGDEDLFEPAPAAVPAPSLTVVGEQPERIMPDRKPAEAAKGDPRDRIVFMRRASSEETSIPLADEADDAEPANRSQPGS
jgi:hypothetical protein